MNSKNKQSLKKGKRYVKQHQKNITTILNMERSGPDKKLWSELQDFKDQLSDRKHKNMRIEITLF